MRESSVSLPASTLSKLAQLAELLQQASYLAREISLPQSTPKLSTRERNHPIPEDQAWFWTDAWQAREREVDEQLARGEYDEFENMEAMIADLHTHI